MPENGAMETEIDLKEILHILRIRWWIILLTLIVSVSVGTAFTYFYIEPVYKAETLMFLGKEDNNIAGIDLAELRVQNELIFDYREIIKSRLVSYEVIEDLNLDVDLEEFQKNVEVTTIQNSRLFKIAYQSTDPKKAVEIANKLSNVIIDKAEEIVEVKNVKLIDKAILPEQPIKPNKKLNIAISGVLGLFIGVFIIFLIEYLDNTIKSERDVERYLGLNIIGEIPRFKGERRNKKGGKSKKNS